MDNDPIQKHNRLTTDINKVLNEEKNASTQHSRFSRWKVIKNRPSEQANRIVAEAIKSTSRCWY